MELLEKLRAAVRELRSDERAERGGMRQAMEAGPPAPGIQIEDLEAMVRSASRRARSEGAQEAHRELSRSFEVMRRRGEQEAETRGVLAGLRSAVDLVEAVRERDVTSNVGPDSTWRRGGPVDNMLSALKEPLNDALASVAQKGMHGERAGQTGCDSSVLAALDGA